MTVEDLFRKIGAQTMEIEALRAEIERLNAIVSSLQSTAEAQASNEDKAEKKKEK